MTHRLVGDWALVSYDTVSADGSRTPIFGEAVGRLSYSASGLMSGQVMRPDRPRVSVQAGAQQVRAAYTGYIAYFGTYEVNDEGDTVTHYVAGALNPSWVGGQQVRRLRFAGDLLVLQAEVEKAGQMVTHELTWRKLP